MTRPTSTLAHLGAGVLSLLGAGLAILAWEWLVLGWVQKRELAAAFWLTLADFGLGIAAVVLIVVWVVTLLRGRDHYDRLQKCLGAYFARVTTVIFGSLFPAVVGVFGLVVFRWLVASRGHVPGS